MGVHGLWELLAPVGRRVSVETLTGKKLAIDASIWMIQFMKAMRDEKGEMVRNAHLIGFFRRICKLLFLRTKPVFVFDGGTPALKRRTVIARRRQRENAQNKIRKTAEKLLLNHLKSMKLKELADDIKNQRQANDNKGKKVLLNKADLPGSNEDTAIARLDQEKLDEMLAASIAAGEEENITGNAMAFVAEEDDGSNDENEEMILPPMIGKVDAAVLAALPPSMQLDLLVQMRARLMAENRQKYQKVKKAPAKFSELQIQSYLKTVAFRREIDEVQKSAAGRGIGGVQTSRIASEANREFIFSSSFSGDKQAFTSSGAELNGDSHRQKSTCGPMSTLDGSVCVDDPHVATVDKCSIGMGMVTDESGRVTTDNTELRAMGIRTTRDLQRNLDMMKEIEKDRANIHGDPCSAPEKNGLSKPLHEDNGEGNPGPHYSINRNQQSVSKCETSVEISFENVGEHNSFDDGDDIFAQLVEGNAVSISSIDDTCSKMKSCDSLSDSDWEEGAPQEMVDCFAQDVEANPFSAETGTTNDNEVEWEEGVRDTIKIVSAFEQNNGKSVSRGVLEEEADFQEAVRRSLEDLKSEKAVDVTPGNKSVQDSREKVHEGFLHKEDVGVEANFHSVSFEQRNDHGRVPGVEKPDGLNGIKISQIADDPGKLSASSMASNSSNSQARYHHSYHDLSEQDIGGSEKFLTEQVTPFKTEEFHSAGGQLLDYSRGSSQILTPVNVCQSYSSTHLASVLDDFSRPVLVDDYANSPASGGDYNASKPSNLAVPTGESSIVKETGVDDIEKLIEENDQVNQSMEKTCKLGNTAAVTREHGKIQVQSVFSEALLEEEILLLGQESINLGDEQRKYECNAESVSSEMFAECQELLQMFGLPYIIAPMEAEAQCAYMDLMNLVDGVVTDDSDVFLFGAQSVYKNIFDDRKYVETYFMKDIENELGLTREKLIRMALLLGSDYTEGISGIGIVNAIEVVNAFREEEGLHKFREWVESPDPTILGNFHTHAVSSSSKRESLIGEDGADQSKIMMEGVSGSVQNLQAAGYIQDKKQNFMDKHRNVSKNWHIPSSFPSEAVISAYASPQVDKSTEPFSWGKPDLHVLRKLCWEKFGWDSAKADELVLPVLKEYTKHETQLRLEAFYTFNERFAKVRSKRIKKALSGITGKQSTELASESRKRRQGGQGERPNKKPENLMNGKDSRNKSDIEEVQPPKRSRERKMQRSLLLSEGKKLATEGSNRGRRLKSRGKSKGLGKGRKELELSGRSSSNSENSDSGQEVHIEKPKEPHELRRSKRPRRPVNYAAADSEADRKSVDHYKIGKDCSGKEASPEKPLGCAMGPSPESCGGFFMDKDEREQFSLSQSCSPLLEAELSKDDHLRSGGGFCMDEGGESVNNSVDPLQYNFGGDSSAVSVRALSAMPFLRRKKRT